MRVVEGTIVTGGTEDEQGTGGMITVVQATWT